MRVEHLLRRIAIAALLVATTTCGGDSPTESIGAPSDLAADAVGTTTVRVSWRPSGASDVSGYEIQRRKDLRGDFETIEDGVPGNGGARIAYFDTHVEANTYYGYRVRAISKLGARSSMTNIAGTKTASSPGMRITTATTVPNAESGDPDGYTAVIRGPRDTTSVALAVTGERIVSLPRGTYTVVLRGMAVNCATLNASDTLKTATITDEGIQTITPVTFAVSCRDPKKASIVVVHTTNGDSLDADGLALTVSGIIRESGTPANERVYFQSRKLEGRTGATRFDNLRLGDYELSIGDVDPPCTLEGDRVKTLSPKALAVDTVRFAVTCRKPAVPVDTVGKPFVLRHRWSSATARQGDKVSILTSVDLRAQASQELLGVSATMQYDNAVVRYDSARSVRAFDITTVNSPQAGTVALAATNTSGQGVTGQVDVVRIWFTVLGATGTSVRTSTTIDEALSPTLTTLTSKFRPDESTLTVSNVAPTNQAPTARITAPTTGTVGTAISFSGSPSSDPDGTIASYAWTFGDNSSATGVSASHSYSSAGTYTVRLTVTDNGGATGFVEQSIVISSAQSNTGTVGGTVTSTQRGPLSGVTVTVDGGGGTATTDATGAYTISSVAVGSKTLSLTNLPTGCTAPSSQTVSVTANATATANFAVTCTATATTGTVSGKVTKASDGSGIAGAQVAVLAAGATTAVTVTTGSDGSYSAANVPIGSGATAGTGSITLQQLPSGCTNPGSQSYTGLTAGGTVTKDVPVTCTGTSTTGTVTGTISKSTGGVVSGMTVTLTPTGGSALTSVSSNGSGVYTVTNVPVGAGAIALSNLPTGCTAPASPAYTGVTAGGTVTVNLTLTCTAQTGSVTGTITKSTGGNASGVQVVLTPTGGTALPAVTTNTSGVYTVANVPVGAGGAIALSTLPTGCTVPAGQTYGAVTAGAPTTKNITLTCTGGFSYPISATWGAITNTGPTGKQVTLTLRIDMGAAPGLPDVAGANADPLLSLQYGLDYDKTKITYTSRVGLSPDEFDLVSANQPAASTEFCTTTLCGTVASTSGSTKTGAFDLVRLTFNIVSGATGSVTPIISAKELLVTSNSINKTSTASFVQPPALTIP